MIRIRRALAGVSQAFHAADDPPYRQRDQDRHTDQYPGQHHADRTDHQAEPERADLQLVMRAQPFGRVVLVKYAMITPTSAVTPEINASK